MVLKRGFIFALAFLLGIILFLDIVSANLAENASWLDENLTNSNYGTHSTILVGDIDNDGDKDFILSGCTDSNCQNPELTNVYLNNRTSLIINTTWSQNLTAMGSGGGYLADIDNDGDLDLLFTGSAIDFIIYVNNGETFTQNSTWEANVVSNGGGSSDMVLGDIDNDGDLDLVMDGSTNTQTVFLNNGSVFVNNATWGSAIGSASFNRNHMFDYDNDGDLDFILSGFSGGASYFNNGTNFTEDPDGPIGGGERISNTMGDIDNDGDIDYLQIREDNSCGRDVKVNKGGIFNSNSTWENFAGGLFGSMALGDFTNNGYLGLVVARSCGADASNKVFVNNGTTFNDNQTLQGALRLAQVWVDINDDGKLDLFSTSIIYLNNLTTTNTPPSPPTTLSTIFDRNTDLINFSWDAGSDTETPATGLYYNLRVGTTSGGNEIVTGVYGSASSHDSGGSRVTGFFGNMMQRKAIKLKNNRFEEGTTYYWSVQTIDTGLANGSWSGEYLFNTTADWTEPSITLNNPIDLFNTSNFIVSFNATVYDIINLSNVSLYGNWSGAFSLNSTNASGFNNTDYLFNVNFTSNGDGTYKWLINACDNLSNCVNTSARTFTIDTTAPVVSLNSPANDSWTNNAAVDFQFTATDSLIQACTLYGDFNGAFQANISNTSMVSNIETTLNLNLNNGTFLWNIYCNDTVGNAAFNGTNFTVNIDTEKPAINLNAPVNNFNTSITNILFNWTVIDNLDGNLPCNITINNTINISNIASVNGTHTNKTINNFNDGFYFWNVSCNDNATNVNFSVTRNFTVDTIFPNITLDYPLSNSWLNTQNTIFNFTLIEINPKKCLLFANFSGSFVENQSINPQSGKNNFSQKTIADGNYIWGVFCNDTVNHENYSINFTLNIDTIFPAVRLDHPKNNSNFSSNPIQFNFTATESNLEACSLYLNSSGWHKNTTKTDAISGSVFNIANLTLADGNYLYDAVCNDSAGNEAFNNSNFTFSVDTAAPVVTLLSPLNSSTIATSDVVARASFSDQNIVNCQARIDSGAFQEMSGDGITAGTASFIFTSQSDAQHTVRINCTDTSFAKFSNMANTTFTVDTTITDTSKPNLTINFPSNNSILTASPVNFELNYSDENNVNCKLINGTAVFDFDNDNATSGTANLTLALHDKNHTISANCTDASSNQNNITLSIWSFYLDKTYPVVTLRSPANNTRQTSSSTVTFSYNVTDLGIKNCSLVIDGNINLTGTSISTGTPQTFSKTLGNANYNWSVECADNAGLTNSSSIFNLTVSFTESGSSGSSSSSGGGGGGGGGGGAAATAAEGTTKTQVWSALPEGTTTMKVNKEEIAVQEIEINVKSPASNVEVSVSKLDSKPASIPQEVKGKVYQYIEIKKKNLKDEDINNADINFKVEKSWLINNNADENEVILNRYTAFWEELETSKLNSDATYIYYKAVTPSFSYFAILVKEKVIPEEIIENITTTNVTEALTEINETEKIEEEPQKKGYNFAMIITAFIIILIVLISYLKYWRKKK
ncbi:PGF-pre-PGF domain-containing protein [Candidatus Woesearchaeota archaeon]|nr:PGF-pre-PGF domain-containing protein [Candidatus Woesearchaeota archaeon]